MADSTFFFKKTTDLTPHEKDQIRALFLDVFAKEKTSAHFDSEFLVTTLGYSFHGLLIHDSVIVGCYSSVPYRYRFFDTECLFALSVDTMIKKEFRGLETLRKLANLVYAELNRAGVEFAFGFPNDNIYKIRKRFFGWKDLGTLDYFVLPVRPGAFVKHGRWLHLPVKAGVFLLNLAGRLFTSSNAPPDYAISVVNDELFQRHRYGFFAGDYLSENLGPGNTAIYRMDYYNGIKVAFILDVTVLSRHLLQTAAQRILARHHTEIDAIVYVGKLRFCPVNLLRVPKRFEPKKEYMSGKILAGNVVDERIFDLNNWRVNLANFDVI